MPPRDRHRTATLAWFAAAGLAAGLIIRTLVGSLWAIPSQSMEPTLAVGDLVLSTRAANIGRWDVVVFRDPGGWLTGDPDDHTGTLVKRVVGLPGEHLTCPEVGDDLTIDGRPADDPWGPCDRTFDVTVPDGTVWVEGDNRTDSADSRLHQGTPSGGFVALDLIRGRVVAVIWPPTRLGLVRA